METSFGLLSLIPSIGMKMDSEDYHDEKQVAGSLLLTHEGCDLYYRLVVTGPMRGTVWEDSRGADCGVAPLEGANGNPITFAEWISQFGWSRGTE